MGKENQRFRHTAKRYRKHFSLTEEDISSLMKSKDANYKGVESGRKSLDFDLADEIAGVYGLRYFQMADPKQEIPDIDSLPEKTKKEILDRCEKGKKLRNDELQLPLRVTDALNSGGLPQEFTSSDVWELLPEEIKEKVKTIRITDLFNKGQLKKMIEETGEKRGREKLYRLVID